MRQLALILALFCAALPAPASAQAALTQEASSQTRPLPRIDTVPRARWDFRREGRLWTRATLSALAGHGQPLIETVPTDIADWCPAYPENSPKQRAAFWNGLLSALVKHESTFRPEAVGGGGKWYGLTQILPATAHGYGCRARSGEALKDGAANLSCAVRILAVTVPRDGVVALKDGRLAGVAADWGPMTKRAKRADIAAYTKRQKYCRLLSSVPPLPRPDTVVLD